MSVSWWLGLTYCAWMWTAGWEGTEQCFGLVPAAPRAMTQKDDLNRGKLPRASVSLCKKLVMILIFFFFWKHFHPCCWKEPDALWLTQVHGIKAGCLGGTGCFRQGALRAGAAGGARLSEVFTSWTSEVISVGHHFGLKIDFIRWKWKWTEEMNCKPHCCAYKVSSPALHARM